VACEGVVLGKLHRVDEARNVFAEMPAVESPTSLVFGSDEINRLAAALEITATPAKPFDSVQFLRRRFPEVAGDGVLETPVSTPRRRRATSGSRGKSGAEPPAAVDSDSPSGVRRRAQLALIGALLTSEAGLESRLLKEQMPLVDSQFVALLRSVADRASNPHHAAYLNKVASTLEDTVEVSEEHLQARVELLVELLNAAVRQDGAADFHRLVTSKADLIDGRTFALFRTWMDSKIAEAPPEKKRALGIRILAFGQISSMYHWTNRVFGDLAMAAYEGALNALSIDESSFEWAQAQSLIGDQLLHDGLDPAGTAEEADGDGAAVERAINAYRAALDVFTPEEFPYDWAKVSRSLGRAVIIRKQGSPSQNLEQAIDHYRAAVDVFTRERFPREWASTQSDIGVALLNRTNGEPALNVSNAITSFRSALDVFSREDSPPMAWAMAQLGLSNAYTHSEHPYQERDAEAAVAASTAAMEVLTKEQFPHFWALAQANLGNAYGNRAGGSAENKEMAIRAWRAAAEMFVRHGSPKDRCKGWYTLGMSYIKRIAGDPDENREIALAAFRAAVTEPRDAASSWDWASAQLNLGSCYVDRKRGDRWTKWNRRSVRTIRRRTHLRARRSQRTGRRRISDLARPTANGFRAVRAAWAKPSRHMKPLWVF
jgi:tetratricopeptide (TPR) repeat protein